MFKKKTPIGSVGASKSPASTESSKKPATPQIPSKPVAAQIPREPGAPEAPRKAEPQAALKRPEPPEAVRKAELPPAARKPETPEALKQPEPPVAAKKAPKSPVSKASGAGKSSPPKSPAEEVTKVPEAKVPVAPAKPVAPPKSSPEAKPLAEAKPTTAEPSRAPQAHPGAALAAPAAGAPPVPAPVLAASFLDDVESRIRRAVEDLEKRLSTVAKPAAPQKPAPKSDELETTEKAANGVDAVTASFRRALGEAIDRKLEEALAPAVALYQRLLEEAREIEEDPSSLRPADLAPILSDALGDLEKILRLLGGDFIRPKVGEYYDPLIHLAVGEAGASGRPQAGGAQGPGGVGAAGVVAEVVRQGYRSQRGLVVIPAKVVVGRR